MLEDRLGAVVRLGHGVQGPFGALDDALEGYGEVEEDDHKPGHEEGHKPVPVPLGGARKVTINARTVVLNAHHGGAAVAEADPDQDHGHGHGHSHDHGDAHDPTPGHDKPAHGGHGHAPRKRLDGKAQTAAIRAAVHDFSDYWSDRPARLKDLREARRQLTTGHASASGDRVWDRAK